MKLRTRTAFSRISASLILLALVLTACSPSPTTPPPTRTVETLPPPSPTQPIVLTATSTDLPYSETPQTPVTPTYDPAAPDSWKLLPVVPESVSERVKQIYATGINSGMNSRAFSKIGDCETSTEYFLMPFDYRETGYRLGTYESLKELIQDFKGSFARRSLAAKPGFSVSSALSPVWADPLECKPEQSPLSCELGKHRPVFALITFGTNDVNSTRETFEANLRSLLDVTISYNVVPILATKADNLEGDGSINAIIARLAYEYEIPLWNFWRALQYLPNGGLQEDLTHLTYAQPFFDSPENMQFGWPVRNLTALQVLEKVRQEVEK